MKTKKERKNLTEEKNEEKISKIAKKIRKKEEETIKNK